MANTTTVYARIDTGLKENAEAILAQLGITPSAAIQMLYSQIILQHGIPFDLHLPAAHPTAIAGKFRTSRRYSSTITAVSQTESITANMAFSIFPPLC